MDVCETDLPGVLLVKPKVYEDDRGSFLETFHAHRYAQAGMAGPFVQDNFSTSRRNVLRGLHFQHPHGQGKLVSVVRGEVFDVAVDIRYGSPTIGRWTSARLSADNKWQLYIPPGFAHGFCTLSEMALVTYKSTEFYNPDTEGSVFWNDPEISIDWPITLPLLSQKDAAAPTLRSLATSVLPPFHDTHA